MARWNPYVTELMLFPNSITSLCQAKELCWPRGQGPPLSLAGRAQELRADMKLLASEGGEKVWVVTSAKEQGEEMVGPRQRRHRAVLQLQSAIVKEALPSWRGEDGERGTVEDGGWQGEDGNMVAAKCPSPKLISPAITCMCPLSVAGKSQPQEG